MVCRARSASDGGAEIVQLENMAEPFSSRIRKKSRKGEPVELSAKRSIAEDGSNVCW
jgi:hypothetical protein